MWSRSETQKCPICDTLVLVDRDTIEGTLMESETRCDHCRQYSDAFSYGHYEVRVGFVTFEWSHLESSPHKDIREAEVELRGAYQCWDFGTVHTMPPEIAADWFADHGCPQQEAGCRAIVATRAPPA